MRGATIKAFIAGLDPAIRRLELRRPGNDGVVE
jgi:hypothetical protein